MPKAMQVRKETEEDLGRRAGVRPGVLQLRTR
jgi:hypothetical protein